MRGGDYQQALLDAKAGEIDTASIQKGVSTGKITQAQGQELISLLPKSTVVPEPTPAEAGGALIGPPVTSGPNPSKMGIDPTTGEKETFKISDLVPDFIKRDYERQRNR